MARRPKLAEESAGRIAAGLDSIHPGEWLPPTRELETTYGVALGTVQAAVSMLAEQDLVEAVPSRGVRTIDPTKGRVVLRSENDQALTVDGERGFRLAVRQAGLEPWDETPGRQWVQADPEVANRLGVATGARVFRRTREHGWIDHDRRVHVMLSATWIISELVEQIPVLTEESTGPGGMTSRFEEIGLVTWWEVTTYARTADAAEAEWLGMARGSAVLDVWRRCFDQNGRILEVTQRVIDSSKHQVTFAYGAGRAPRA